MSAVLYVKEKWDKYPRLKKKESQEYIKFISRYETILNRRSNTASKISNLESVGSIIDILEIIII